MEAQPQLESVVPFYYPPRKLVGRVYLPDLSQIEDQPLRYFAYPVDFSLAAFGTFQTPLVVGHRFWLCALTGASNQAGAFRVFIRDGKTRQPFMKISVNNLNLIGTAQHPLFLRSPHLIPQMRPILVQAADLSGAANTIEIVLHGAIYDG